MSGGYPYRKNFPWSTPGVSFGEFGVPVVGYGRPLHEAGVQAQPSSLRSPLRRISIQKRAHSDPGHPGKPLETSLRGGNHPSGKPDGGIPKNNKILKTMSSPVSLFRTLRPDEIYVRVEKINENREGEVVLYKDARVDMNILDEVFPMKWKRIHTIINGMNYCTVSVWNDEIRQWIDRTDVGTEQNFEREKSAASDSFKRACTNIGIGKELYTVPKDARIKLAESELEYGQNGRLYARRDVLFYVNDIAYDANRKISRLRICDMAGNPRYIFPASDAVGATAPAAPGGQTTRQKTKGAQGATTQNNVSTAPTYIPPMPPVIQTGSHKAS